MDGAYRDIRQPLSSNVVLVEHRATGTFWRTSYFLDGDTSGFDQPATWEPVCCRCQAPVSMRALGGIFASVGAPLCDDHTGELVNEVRRVQTNRRLPGTHPQWESCPLCDVWAPPALIVLGMHVHVQCVRKGQWP